MTLLELALVLGFKNASTYMKYEKGNYTFKADQLPLLAKALDCTIEELFLGNNSLK
ncbi:helix-turn-helix transcriptional regulator [Bacillus cereus]|uniref:helix-turn-helix transcriptional regulator n=1 Tax=Bacillus cereus TaxID=1396 RepID=UPI0011454BB0|nr:helix-turn-helix transcriptional regulator [Bacillus cereus]